MINYNGLTLTTRKTLRLTIRTRADCCGAPDYYQIFYADSQHELAKMLIDYLVDEEKFTVDYLSGKEVPKSGIYKSGIYRVSLCISQTDVMAHNGVDYDWEIAKSCSKIKRSRLEDCSSDIAEYGRDDVPIISEKDFLDNEVLSSEYLWTRWCKEQDKCRAAKEAKDKEAEESRRAQYEKLKKEFEK